VSVWRPQALLGAPLSGSRWVKQIHMDEAGTSARESYAVVSAVIIDPDKQFALAEERVAENIERYIPSHLRDGFIFHAKDVFGKHKKSEGWSWDYCNQITDAWLKIPHDLNIPVGMSWIKKSMDSHGRCRTNDEAHMIAFAHCAQCVDEFMQQYVPDEVASLIAEDCPPMRRKLHHIIAKLKRGGLAGQSNFAETITHIKNGVMFAEKEHAPLLQIADAYAFAFKRHLNGAPGGERFWSVIIGDPRGGSSLSGSPGGRLLVWKHPTS
jgi:hypothetical protein